MAWRRGAGAVLSLTRSLELQGNQNVMCSNQTVAPALRAIMASCSSWRGWELGFSTATGQEQAGKNGADEAAAAAAAEPTSTTQTQAAASEQANEDLSAEELQQALNLVAQELVEEKKKSEDMKEKLLRTLADMENLRDRTQRQTAEIKQFAVQGLVKSLLEVADNLERAAGSVPEHEVEESTDKDPDRLLGLLRSLRDGVLMTEGTLLKILAKEGVTRYDPLGEAFDPNLHMALFELPDATKDPGTVAVVIKKGYMLHDRAVRAAEVGVAKATEEGS